MKDQLNTTTQENSSTIKKAWQTPSIEIISRDNVQSGNVAGRTEGGATSNGVDHYNHS